MLNGINKGGRPESGPSRESLAAAENRRKPKPKPKGGK